MAAVRAFAMPQDRSLGSSKLWFAPEDPSSKEITCMSVRIPVTIEIPDEALEELRKALVEGPADPDPPRPIAAAEVELPSSWQLVEEQHGVPYTWGGADDEYDPFRVYEGQISSGTIRLAIGECERTLVAGRDRKYYIVMLIGPESGKRAIAEFLETDDHDATGDMIAIIRGRDGSGKLFDPGEDLPAVYEPWVVETYRDRVDYSGAYVKQALVCSETDSEVMLNHALAQIQLRGLAG
jgi:hypothetical protein